MEFPDLTFSNLHNLFYNSCRKPPRNSMTSRFPVFVIYFILVLANTHRSTGLMASLFTACIHVRVNNFSKSARLRDMLLLLKDTLSIEDDKS